MKCPKCDTEVLIGNKNNPNHCGKCHYEWDVNKDSNEGEKNVKHVEESLHSKIALKAQKSFLTYNLDLRRTKPVVDRIDTALSETD
jgi:DNA-directed RNA polymerase subunit M/transcription elongation factor TFIIS